MTTSQGFDLEAVGQWLVTLGHAPEPPLLLAGFPTREQLLATYAMATGRDVSAVGFWYALALWKIAIIIEGVRQRALADGRHGASAGAPPATVVDALLRRAAAVAPATA